VSQPVRKDYLRLCIDSKWHNMNGFLLGKLVLVTRFSTFLCHVTVNARVSLFFFDIFEVLDVVII